jgi:hypothetical protein
MRCNMINVAYKVLHIHLITTQIHHSGYQACSTKMQKQDSNHSVKKMEGARDMYKPVYCKESFMYGSSH